MSDLTDNTLSFQQRCQLEQEQRELEMRTRTTTPEITGGGLQLQQRWCRNEHCHHTAPTNGAYCPVCTDMATKGEYAQRFAPMETS